MSDAIRTVTGGQVTIPLGSPVPIGLPRPAFRVLVVAKQYTVGSPASWRLDAHVITEKITNTTRQYFLQLGPPDIHFVPGQFDVTVSNGRNELFFDTITVATTLAALSTMDLNTNDAEALIATHIVDRGNPHRTTAAQVGLGNVDNTADMEKPVSFPVKNAIDLAVHNLRTEFLVSLPPAGSPGIKVKADDGTYQVLRVRRENGDYVIYVDQ